MATVYKILGQTRGASVSDTDLMVVAANKNQVVSTVVVANTTASAAAFRLHALTSGSTASEANAIAYGTSVAGNDSLCITIGATLSASSRMIVRNLTASALTFTAFGSEIDV